MEGNREQIARSRAHVVHVTTAHPATDNRILYKECSALAGAGFQVSLIARTDHDFTTNDVEVHAIPTVPGRLKRMIIAPVIAWRKLRSQNPSLVHLHDPELIPFGLLWRALHRTPVIYDAHEDLELQIRNKPYIPSWAKKPASVFGKYIQAVAGLGMNGVVVAIPDFVDKYRRSLVATVQNYPWLRAYEEPVDAPDNRTFAYVGAVSRIRGVSEMCKAVAISRSGARLVVAGPGQNEDSLATLDAESRVKYLGRVDPTKVPRVIADSIAGLVVLHPTKNHLESRPTKLFEYMAAGRPFIASDFPYWRRLVGEDCGIFVDPNEPAEIAQAMDWLIENPSEARAMGRRGRQRFETEFTFEVEAASLIKMVDTLLGTKPSSNVACSGKGEKTMVERTERNG
ncbi:glycosyltransferase family 4 protein [Georgenia sp. Z1344]|uniref:glycosyltransferase family 4 protein n=1 Tax=Georgenia sp. Z1344 TaxID=3416706 RepID=UPI003CEB47EF